jgi:hypothetical protein
MTAAMGSNQPPHVPDAVSLRAHGRDDLGPIHTIRFPQPLWSLLLAQGEVEKWRGRASEIVRARMNLHARELLRHYGVAIEDNEAITYEHVQAYRAAASGRR